MREWIKGIGRFLFGNNAKIENQQRPMIEPLEGRQFLSVSIEGGSLVFCEHKCSIIDWCEVVSFFAK